MFTEKDRSFIIRAVTVASLVALLFAVFVYANMLYEGRAVFPDQITQLIILLLGAAVTSASVWLRRGDHQRTREAVHDEAESVKRSMRDGGAKAVAAEVKKEIEPVIREGDRRQLNMPNAGKGRRRDDM